MRAFAVTALLLALPILALAHDGKVHFGDEAALATVAEWVDEEFNALVTALEQEEGVPAMYFGATLSGENQVPTPLATNTTGSITIACGNNSAVWLLEVDGVYQFTMSHLHYGSSSENGPVVVLLGPSGDNPADGLKLYSPPLSGSVALVGTFNATNIALPSTNSPTLADLTDAIMAGNVYANIHTTGYPAGLIRAQLTTISGM